MIYLRGHLFNRPPPTLLHYHPLSPTFIQDTSVRSVFWTCWTVISHKDITVDQFIKGGLPASPGLSPAETVGFLTTANLYMSAIQVQNVFCN